MPHRAQAWLGAVLMFAGVAASRPGGDQSTDRQALPTFHVGVDAVRIDAVVTDKHGRVVTDLTADDFELRQDGDRQVVTLAQYVGESSPVSTSEPTTAPRPEAVAAVPTPPPHRPLAPERVHRTIALVVDDLGLSWESIRDTRRAMNAFIDERVQPGDLVGILRTSTYSGALQQFTTDKRRLHDIVDQVRWTALSRRGVEAFPAIDFPSHAGGGYGSTGMDTLTGSSINVGCNAWSAVDTINTLRRIAQGARPLRGRKVIVLLSEGFCLNMEGGFLDPRLRTALDRLYDQAARAGVVIYTLDVRGLQTGGLNAADNAVGLHSASDDPQYSQARVSAEGRYGMQRTTQDSLWLIAHETGGQAIENTNDLAAGLARVDEAERGYYVLGYTPTASTFAKPGKTVRFHKISLRVTRPGLDVRVRSGFLGHADAPSGGPQTPAEQMFLAATSPFVQTTIPVEATVLPGFTREDGNYVRVLLHVDLWTLTPTEEQGHEVMAADVLALVFDEWGNEITRRANTLTFTPEGGDESAGAVVYSIKLPVAHGGGFAVRLALRDRASGDLGSAGQFVEVQDAAHGDFGLSGVLLARNLAPRAAAASDAGTTPAAGPGDPTRRDFAPGDPLVYTYEIYNAHDVVEATPSVWHDGRQVFAAPTASIAPGSGADAPLKVGGGIRLPTTIAPGYYVFQLAVTSKGQKGRPKALVRQTDFQVY